MEGMTFADYQQIDAVNISTLKYLRRSPLHYQHALKTRGHVESAALAFGSAVHTAVFEPAALDDRIAVWTGARMAGKEWDAFVTANAGKMLLKQDDMRRVLAIRDAVLAHPVAESYLREGEAEVTLEWTDPATQIRCKGRLDWLGPDAILDLKTTLDISERSFSRTTHAYAYHLQAAWYRAGFKALYGVDKPFVFIAVEKTAPYDVAVYKMDDDSLYCGKMECACLLHTLKACSESGHWPGQCESETELSLPAWAFTDDDNAVEVEDIIDA